MYISHEKPLKVEDVRAAVQERIETDLFEFDLFMQVRNVVKHRVGKVTNGNFKNYLAKALPHLVIANGTTYSSEKEFEVYPIGEWKKKIGVTYADSRIQVDGRFDLEWFDQQNDYRNKAKKRAEFDQLTLKGDIIEDLVAQWNDYLEGLKRVNEEAKKYRLNYLIEVDR